MIPERGFIPFDIKCYSKLEDRFAALFEPRLINEICQYGKLRTFKPDETIIDIGMHITHMPLVISGSLKVLTEDEKGDELLLYYLQLGETCAVTLNCCTNKIRSTVKAITETKAEIVFVPVEKMEDWMIQYTSWRRYVLNSYNERLNEMVRAIDSIVFQGLEERLLKYLRNKASMVKSAVLNISHQDIANDLHASRVAISRLMKKLELKKSIAQQRNKIIVLEFKAD
jgi:CRP/FNR family transcriptional regulator, anaerobic regulatory protein